MHIKLIKIKLNLSSHTGSSRLRNQTSAARMAEYVLLPRKLLASMHHYLLIPGHKITCRNINRRDEDCGLRCFSSLFLVSMVA